MSRQTEDEQRDAALRELAERYPNSPERALGAALYGVMYARKITPEIEVAVLPHEFGAEVMRVLDLIGWRLTSPEGHPYPYGGRPDALEPRRG